MQNLIDFVRTVGVARFAKDIDVTKSRVYQIINGPASDITPEMCVRIEIATSGKIKRAALRPDVFGKLL